MKVICYVMIVVLIPLIAFVAGTLIVSRMYWGYWLGPPSSDVTVRDVKSVERCGCPLKSAVRGLTAHDV